MQKYDIHDDFKKFTKLKSPMYPLLLPLVNGMCSLIFAHKQIPAGVKESKVAIAGYQGKSVALTIYEPEGLEKDAPCLIYFHGGAFILKAAPQHKVAACAYALQASCKVIFVDYHLAPRHPFPAGVEDCYAAFLWACKTSDQLGIDKNRIAVAGDSAGGAIAAAVCLMARDRKAPKICFQMLIYPVTDVRQTTDSMKAYIDTPIWDAKQNAKMWKLYLKNGVNEHPEYASPMAATHAHLPAAYVEVAQYDCLHDEGIAYAQALKQSGVQVELYETKQTVHGFEIAEKSDIVIRSIARRAQALQKAFAEHGKS